MIYPYPNGEHKQDDAEVDPSEGVFSGLRPWISCFGVDEAWRCCRAVVGYVDAFDQRW